MSNLIKKHAKSFYWASFFLSKPVFNKCSSLYNFCRTLDDIVDNNNNLVVKKEIFLKFKKDFENKNLNNQIIKDMWSVIDNENISLFLGSDFHQVIYPVNQNGDLNFIAIMKYQLTLEQQKNYSLFKENSFIRKVLEKVPKENKEFFDKIKELKIFPVFIRSGFFVERMGLLMQALIRIFSSF